MENCIFCKITARKIPSDIIYENDHVMAFLDIRPITKGHALIVPKAHHESLFDTPEKTLAELVAVAKKVGAAAKQAVNADGINLGMNNGAAAGQVVMHAHLHVIPRFRNDGLHHWPNRDTTPEALKDVAEKVRGQLQ
jgi:histidine triad (HIT) family protein